MSANPTFPLTKQPSQLVALREGVEPGPGRVLACCWQDADVLQAVVGPKGSLLTKPGSEQSCKDGWAERRLGTWSRNG